MPRLLQMMLYPLQELLKSQNLLKCDEVPNEDHTPQMRRNGPTTPFNVPCLDGMLHGLIQQSLWSPHSSWPTTNLTTSFSIAVPSHKRPHPSTKSRPSSRVNQYLSQGCKSTIIRVVPLDYTFSCHGSLPLL